MIGHSHPFVHIFAIWPKHTLNISISITSGSGFLHILNKHEQLIISINMHYLALFLDLRVQAHSIHLAACCGGSDRQPAGGWTGGLVEPWGQQRGVLNVPHAARHYKQFVVRTEPKWAKMWCVAMVSEKKQLCKYFGTRRLRLGHPKNRTMPSKGRPVLSTLVFGALQTQSSWQSRKMQEEHYHCKQMTNDDWTSERLFLPFSTIEHDQAASYSSKQDLAEAEKEPNILPAFFAYLFLRQCDYLQMAAQISKKLQYVLRYFKWHQSCISCCASIKA